MTGGSHIVAIDAIEADDTAPAVSAEAPAAESWSDEDWAAEPDPAPRRWPVLLAAGLALGAVVGWSVLFGLANGPAMRAGGTPAQWAGWVRDWSLPVALVGVAWLVAMRHSRREAARFGATARMLGEESTRLEARLTTMNHELSLAREFIAAQARDLDALGRLAGDRISGHADRLAGLIADNGSRIDAIGTVSEAALDNMEKLRFQLPVIASSAKDVTNNVAAAGRTAHAQLEEMVQGFNRLNQFGQASESQVKVLRDLVETTLGDFARHTELLETRLQERFALLGQRGEEFRSQLDGHEVEALAAVRTRARALAEEVETARRLLDEHEAESLTSLRARLTAVRDESGAIARSLRESEGTALEAWHAAIERLEADLREAVDRVSEIDAKALESAHTRLTSLAEEAEQVDARMIERDRVFAEEIERRRAEQDATAERLAASSEAMAERLGTMVQRMDEIGAQGQAAEAAIAASLDVLAAKLIASREALAGTDTAIAGLTEGSVRLLELIRAGVRHSEDDLPAAMATSEARLAELAAGIEALRETVQAAEAHGATLAGHVAEAAAGIEAGLARSADLDESLSSKISAIGALRQSLDEVQRQGETLAQHAQGELRSAIAELQTAAHDTVIGLEQTSAAAVSALAGRIGDESSAAIDRAVRMRAAEIAGQLEQAAAHAAGVSREAALQMREQLGKVDELAGNLERRVAQARDRAQDQVDNDFARRVALITESLKSSAIDIARAMDTEVSDTAWASYLKGDRGIFARRAVRLLTTPESRAVTQLYEADREFRDHVARYIHDFEAMLRQLLSTRDGHAMGVTLLSSDMGKLYVALAQAVERLRQ